MAATMSTAIAAALPHALNMLHAKWPPLHLTDSGSRRKKDRRAAGQKKRSRHTTATPRRPLWTIAVAVIFLGALYSLNQVAIDSTLIADIERSQTAAQTKQHPQTDAINYSFYDTLKDTEVAIAEDSGYSSDNQNKQPIHYLIQAGSFKTPQQAERRRAEITLIGLTPRVTHSSNHSGELWYRVRIGPFTSRSEMAEAEATLLANNIEAMVKQIQQ